MSRPCTLVRLTSVTGVPRNSARAAMLACWVAALATGCGGSPAHKAPPPAAPAAAAPAAEAAEPAEPESGESELVRAERDLDDADARLSGVATEGEAMEEGADYESAGPSSATRCNKVCKAYASLLRARDAICRIDGEHGPRCERANFTVERHENTRVACDCPKR